MIRGSETMTARSQRHPFATHSVARWHQGIIWTNADVLSITSCSIHLRAISQEMIQLSIIGVILDIAKLRLQPHLPLTNELKSITRKQRYSIFQTRNYVI